MVIMKRWVHSAHILHFALVCFFRTACTCSRAPEGSYHRIVSLSIVFLRLSAVTIIVMVRTATSSASSHDYETHGQVAQCGWQPLAALCVWIVEPPVLSRKRLDSGTAIGDARSEIAVHWQCTPTSIVRVTSLGPADGVRRLKLRAYDALVVGLVTMMTSTSST